MASIKAIKRRIASVNNTKHIMKAMDLVAASKLQKAKTKLDAIRPLYDNITLVMDGIKARMGSENVAFGVKREVKNIAYVVLTSDRGLCGGYNINVSKEALAFIHANQDKQEKIITVGTKGLEYFRRRGKNVVHKYSGLTETTFYENAERIGNLIASMYTSGEVDEAYLVFTHFESILTHTPCKVKLLPISTESDGESSQGTMAYEPDIATFITYAVPMYLNMFIYGAMVESAVCENASRMTSMDAATRNASAIIDDLTLEYNRKRQGMITQEITEIVSGAANALQ